MTTHETPSIFISTERAPEQIIIIINSLNPNYQLISVNEWQNRVRLSRGRHFLHHRGLLDFRVTEVEEHYYATTHTHTHNPAVADGLSSTRRYFALNGPLWERKRN